MLLYRIGPDGLYATLDPATAPTAPLAPMAPMAPNTEPVLRFLLSDPFTTAPSQWRLGGEAGRGVPSSLLPPVVPGKIVGIGRNYREHAREMDNEVPAEPLLFLKATSSLAGPRTPVVLPPESRRVEYEGEIAVVLRDRLRRASPEQAARAVLGVTCACDVTARDLQRRDATFARAKSFDTFCPLGPAIRVLSSAEELEDLTVVTRINGEERQRAHTSDMVFGIVDLLVYTSRMITLEPRDVLLTGTPGGVGPLVPGDLIEVEIPGIGVLSNGVEELQEAADLAPAAAT